MAQALMSKFAKDNFGRKYIPVLHSRCTSIAPTTLIIKQTRDWWKKPFHRSEMKVLSKLSKFVNEDHEKIYEDISESLLIRSKRKLEKIEVAEVISEHEMNIEIAENVGFDCKEKCFMGDLELGSMDEEYYEDVDLRSVLEKAVVNPDKMALYAPHRLYIVTGVIYSSRLRIRGKRQRRIDVNAHVTVKTRLGGWVSKMGELRGGCSSLKCKAAMVARTKRAPFLFTVCRVIYDKEQNRLKIPDNVFVGKDVVARGVAQLTFAEEDERIEELADVIEAEHEHTESELLHTNELEAKLETVKKLLLSVKSEEERETLIVRCFCMLEGLLNGTKHMLLFQDLSTGQESAEGFLTDLGLQTPDILTTGAQFDAIQDYGLILHYFLSISELHRERWEELHVILNE